MPISARTGIKIKNKMELKPRELMLGNYVYNENKEIVTICHTRLKLFEEGKVKYTAIPVNKETLTTLFNFFKLQDTPDWCKERDTEMYSLFGSTFYVIQTNCGEFAVESKGGNFKTLQGIHHLQNFYFVNNYEDLQPKDTEKYPFFVNLFNNCLFIQKVFVILPYTIIVNEVS